MTQRARTLFTGLVLLFAFALLGVTVPTPFVAIGRGPTFDTLGAIDGRPVVTISDLPTYPTAGQLNMTTVGVTSGLTAAQVLGLWAANDRQVVPRTAVAMPGETEEQAAARNAKLFADSEASAKAAALTYLGLPTSVYVDGLVEGSASAGLLEPGDVLLEAAGRPLTGIPDLRGALVGKRPGELVTVQVRRGDALPQDVVVPLGSRPDSQEGALGILPAAGPASDDEITISLGEVGGPSAGQMFALAVVDKLTPGELTGGRFVAGTGTIDWSGRVGEIQGIRFKMLAAREAGATVFLVPGGNCDEARPTAPDGLQMVRVDDLAGSVAALDTLRSGGTPPTC